MPKTNELSELIRIGDLLESSSQNGGGGGIVTYGKADYSGIITAADTAQDLAAANPNRDRLTIQNLDDIESLLISIDVDAEVGSSVVLDPGGVATLEEGEADKRVSVRSAKTGLPFVAWGRIKQ